MKHPTPPVPNHNPTDCDVGSRPKADRQTHKVCRLTPEEMQRDTLGAIIRACRDIERCAEQMDVAGVKTHFGFLKTTIGRLDVIMTTVQQKPIEI